MADNATTRSTPPGALDPPPDSENEALIDAAKTFKISVIGALLFCLAALYIILGTRLG